MAAAELSGAEGMRARWKGLGSGQAAPLVHAAGVARHACAGARADTPAGYPASRHYGSAAVVLVLVCNAFMAVALS